MERPESDIFTLLIMLHPVAWIAIDTFVWAHYRERITAKTSFPMTRHFGPVQCNDALLPTTCVPQTRGMEEPWASAPAQLRGNLCRFVSSRMGRRNSMSDSNPLTVTLLGPDIDHKNSLEAMLAVQGSRSTWVPDSISSVQGQRLSAINRMKRAFDQLTHTHDRIFLDQVCRHLDENRTDLIIAYWGTRPLADIVAIKRLRPHIKIVLMVLCFPLALDNRGVRWQHWLMRRVAPYLDGILYSNRVMQEYFRRRVLGMRGKHVRELVLKPCWPLSYQADTRNDQTFDRPNLIYVGRTDLSHHTVHVADDLRPLMADILENEIELHHVRSEETADGHPYRRPFEPLNQAGLISKMTAHDASLIAYNAAACERTDRLELTVPDRLLTSVAAGVPIAIPAAGYNGSKEYLADYPAVLQFDSVASLKQQLADREHIRALREAAWKARRKYSAEAQADVLAQFLASATQIHEASEHLQSARQPDFIPSRSENL
jgi:hypothetical protein